MAISLVAMATATLILFLDVVFEIMRQEFRLHIFLVLLSVFREIRRKALIGNDDVIVLMTS